MRVRVAVVLCVITLVVIGIYMAQVQTPEDNPLSVDETMGLVFSRNLHGQHIRLYSHANPEARDAVRLVLKDPELGEFHESAWRILGYIGDESDIALAEQTLGAMNGQISAKESAKLSGMFHSIGVMSRRNVSGAHELSERMVSAEFWEKMQFRFRAEPWIVDFPTEAILKFYDGYAVSGLTNLQARVEKLADRATGEGKEYVAWRSSEKRIIEVSTNLSAGERERVTDDERAELARLSNHDLAHPGPATAP